MEFEDCQEKYKNFVSLEKRNGIVLCRMQTDGGPVRFSMEWHNAMPMLWRDIGADPSNEVFIITGTGDYWISPERDTESTKAFKFWENSFDHFWHDGTMLLEGYLYNIDVPTIAAFNGPGIHPEFGLLSDLVICSDKASFKDAHFLRSMVPGDGVSLVFAERMGLTRAAMLAYTGDAIDARQALEWGLVNEVLPQEKLIERAWKLGEFIISKPRAVRRLTHMTLARRWKRALHEHLGYGLGSELMGLYLAWEDEDGPKHVFQEAN